MNAFKITKSRPLGFRALWLVFWFCNISSKLGFRWPET